MVVKNQIISELKELTTLAKLELQGKNGLGYTDDNKYWEDIIKVILNMCYGYDLVNLNEDQINYHGIDLGNFTKGIGFQVTVTKTGAKVKKTLDKILEHKVYESTRLE